MSSEGPTAGQHGTEQMCEAGLGTPSSDPRKPLVSVELPVPVVSGDDAHGGLRKTPRELGTESLQ